MDTDGDGLPDEWELANGLDPLDAGGNNGRLGDPDGDGANNWQEYLAGTSPTNQLDYLSFDGVLLNDSLCELQFTPRLGRIYTIEKLEEFSLSNVWTTLQSDLRGTNALSVSDPLSSTARFYRLKAALSP